MLFSLLIVSAAVILIARRYEIRLVLLGAGLALSLLGGNPLAVLDTFGRSMVAAMVAPICAAMGFAAVLGATGCDRHLVHLLLAPLRRARWAVLPGGIAAAYLVNLAIPSQASVAAMLGPILIPLITAAGRNAATAGAALVLGASFGGDLLNPAAQDVQALAGVTGVRAIALSARVIPASLVGLTIATLTFALLRRRPDTLLELENRSTQSTTIPAKEAGPIGPINPLKAAIPLVPVALLLLAHAGWVPLGWLLRVEDPSGPPNIAAALSVVRALLIGVGLAAVVGWRDLRGISRSFFEGMGIAYRDIISLTIVAHCFGAGVSASGLGKALLSGSGGVGWRLTLLSIALPWGLAILSGSGSGPVLAFAQACLVPLEGQSRLPTFGALTCLAAAFGRTMSPVSAVVLCCSGLVGLPPGDIIRPMLPALLAGAVASIAVIFLIG